MLIHRRSLLYFKIGHINTQEKGVVLNIFESNAHRVYVGNVKYVHRLFTTTNLLINNNYTNVNDNNILT